MTAIIPMCLRNIEKQVFLPSFTSARDQNITSVTLVSVAAHSFSRGWAPHVQFHLSPLRLPHWLSRRGFQVHRQIAIPQSGRLSAVTTHNLSGIDRVRRTQITGITRAIRFIMEFSISPSRVFYSCTTTARLKALNVVSTGVVLPHPRSW